MRQPIQARLSRRVQWMVGLCVFLILCLGAWSRFYKLDEKSLWSDEIATIATSSGRSVDPEAFRLQQQTFDAALPVPASQYLEKLTIPASTRWQDFSGPANVLQWNVHPPLFFTLMRVFVGTHGLNVWWLRFPAVLFGILSLLLIYLVAVQLARLDRQLSGWQIHTFALLAMGFMALSGYQIDHSQDARPYTLLLCEGLLAVFALLLNKRALDDDEQIPWMEWVVFAGILAAGFYTQYFFSVFALFIVVALAWFGRKSKRFLGQLALSIGLAALFLAPWFPAFKAQMAFMKEAGHYTAGLWNPIKLPEKLWRISCEFFLPQSKTGKFIPFLVFLLASLAWLQRRSWRKAFQWSPVFAFLTAWILLTVGGQIGLDLIKQTHTATIRRYLLLVSPACYMLLAYALLSLLRHSHQWGRWAAGILTVVMLTLMGIDSNQFLFKKHTSSDEFKQAAALINESYKPGDVLLVNKSGAMAAGMAFYLNPSVLMRGVDVPEYAVLQDGTPLMQQLSQAIQPNQRVWLVFSHSAPSTERRFGEWLKLRGYQQSALHTYPGVHVLLWDNVNKG